MRRKCFIFLFILFVFIPKVYAIELSGRGTNNSSLCGNPGSSYDVIDVSYVYDSSLSDDKKVSKIQVDFTLPSGFSVSTDIDQFKNDNDSLVNNGNNSFSLIIGENEFVSYFSGVFSFKVLFTNSQEETSYNFSVVAKKFNVNNEVIETKTLSYKYVVLHTNDNDNCDNSDELTSLKVNGKDVSNIFDAIETNDSSAQIMFVAASPKTKIYQVTGNSLNELSNGSTTANLNYGNNTFEFKIVSECAIVNENRRNLSDTCSNMAYNYEYSSGPSGFQFPLTVNRVDNRSKVNTLKSLTISDVSINFNSDLKSYMATVPYKVSSVKINSSLTDSKSSYVPGFGNRVVNLNEGTNDIQVKVKAENGDEAVYTIKIEREKNDDATLRSIKVDDKEIEIKKDVLKYSTRVENEIVKPTIEIHPTDGNAKYEMTQVEELQEGSNLVEITVTASNGNKLVYILDIIRDSLVSTNSKLKDIKIKNGTFKFESDKETFDVNITSDVEQLELEIVTDNDKAKYVVVGNKNLKNGSQIKIKVTAEDEETITNYTLNIIKESKKINIIFIIPCVLLLIGGIVFIVIKNNKKKNVSLEKDNIKSEESKEINTQNEEENKVDDNINSELSKNINDEKIS